MTDTLHAADRVALPTRQRQRAETHQRLFEVAADELGRHGAAGTSMVAVARRAGVSRQTLYDHFPTLEAVVDEVFARFRTSVAAGVAARVDAATPLEALLHELVDTLFSAMGPASPHLRVEIGAYLLKGVDVAAWIEEPLFQLVAGAVARGQQDATIAATGSPTDLARLLLTSIGGFLLIESEPVASRASRAHQAVSYLIRGLAP